jgi:hypothetical protein
MQEDQQTIQRSIDTELVVIDKLVIPEQLQKSNNLKIE